MPVLPILTTNVVSDITRTSAVSGGNITSNGGAFITSSGICWSTSQHPTSAGPHTTDGPEIGSFSSSMSGLTPGTTYYVRAYAINSVGTGYGNEISFTTVPLTTPIVSTNAILSITSSSASSGGNITNNGGYPITARGVCWSTLVIA